MSSSCDVHSYERAADRCRTCERDYCAECLVWSHGETAPPFCIPCALAASGVRKNAARKPLRKEAASSSGRVALGLAVLAGTAAAAAAAALTLA